MIDFIPFVDAENMSKEVREYCMAHGVTIFYANDVFYVENDENPFWQWLLDLGVANPVEEGKWVAIKCM